MVGEMLAILLFDISEPQINDKAMNKADQKYLFGRTFEKQSQYRRVEILQSLNFTTDDLKNSFDLIRITRKKYLHFWSQDHESLPNDAINVFKAAVSIAIEVLGQKIKDGMIILNPLLIKYLERHGVIDVQDDISEN